MQPKAILLILFWWQFCWLERERACRHYYTRWRCLIIKVLVNIERNSHLVCDLSQQWTFHSNPIKSTTSKLQNFHKHCHCCSETFLSLSTTSSSLSSQTNLNSNITVMKSKINLIRMKIFIFLSCMSNSERIFVARILLKSNKATIETRWRKI